MTRSGPVMAVTGPLMAITGPVMAITGTSIGIWGGLEVVVLVDLVYQTLILTVGGPSPWPPQHSPPI